MVRWRNDWFCYKSHQLNFLVAPSSRKQRQWESQRWRSNVLVETLGISVHLFGSHKADNAQSSVMLWISVQINIWTMQYVSCILVTNSPHAGDARFAVCRRDRKTFDSMHHCTWLQGFIYYLRKRNILYGKCLLPSNKPCEWRQGIEII
jgi:hypothetical protein